MLACGAAGLAWSYMVEPFWLQINHHRLVVPNLPKQWKGKRLVHISDLHVGKASLEYLMQAMQQVNLLEPDVLVVTGDFVDRRQSVDESLDSVLMMLKPAKIASLGCLGNHDFGEGWSSIEISDKVTDIAERNGIRVLRNEVVRIDGIDFSGLEDFWSPLFAPQPVLNVADSKTASICLCHNPDSYDDSDWSLFQGVILSGHTHGGQCKPPFLPPPILPVNNSRYTSGFIELAPEHLMFISRGLGYSRQVRFNCRPEIAVFELA